MGRISDYRKKLEDEEVESSGSSSGGRIADYRKKLGVEKTEVGEPKEVDIPIPKKTFAERFRDYSQKPGFEEKIVTDVIAPIGSGVIRSVGSMAGGLETTWKKTLGKNGIGKLINKVVPEEMSDDIRRIITGAIPGIGTISQIEGIVSPFLKEGREETVGDKLVEYSELVDKSISELSGREANYLRQVSQGLGSSLPFIAGGAAMAAAKVPALIASLSLGGVEALINGYEDYKEILENENDKQATKKAIGSFASNLALNTVTYKLGGLFKNLKPGVLNALKRWFSVSAGETTQEVSQEIISNIFTGKKIYENIGETALVSLPISALFGVAGVTVTPRDKQISFIEDMAKEGATKKQIVEMVSTVTGGDRQLVEQNISDLIAEDNNISNKLDKNEIQEIEDIASDLRAQEEFELDEPYLVKEETKEDIAFKKDEVNPLIEEARKYKSAEEFAENVGAIRDNFDWSYLDEMKARKAAGESYSHSDFNYLSKIEATKRGKESRTFYRAGSIGKDGDIWLTPQEAGAAQYGSAGGTRVGEYKVATQNPLILQDVKSIEKILGKKLASEGNFTNSPSQKQAVIDYAKKNGYDSVLMPDSFPDGAAGMESLVVWDKNLVKTKSQLTDIWNKAQEQPTLKKNRDYRTDRKTNNKNHQGYRKNTWCKSNIRPKGVSRQTWRLLKNG